LLALSGIGLILTLTGGMSTLAVGVMTLLQGGASAGQAGRFFSIAWTSGLVCLLLLPSIYFAIIRLLGKELPARQMPDALNIASVLMLLWPLVLALGIFLSRFERLSWLLMPPLHLLAVGIPLWWLVEVGRKKLPAGSPLRSWGLLSFGLIISPTVAILAEVMVILVVAIGVGFWLVSQPGISQQLSQTLLQLSDMQSQEDLALIRQSLQPYLQQPAVIFSLLSVFAVFVPLIEELIKPLALWTLAGRQLTPAEGFVGGLICGSAFALVESLGFLGAAASSDWVVQAVGRMGTGLLHVTTAGLMGWALASAWGKGQYLKLGLTYLLAVGIHGVWNTFGLLLGLAPQFSSTAAPISIPFAAQMGTIAPIVLGILMAVLLLLLAFSNRRLRATVS
jgi:hypothetical protein